MRYPMHLCGGLLALAIAIPSFGDDQQKAEEQLHKITAMASDGTGRRVVSIALADALGAMRLDLLMERRVMNLNYGDLFIAHALVTSGGKMEDIAAQLKAKKSLGEIANEQHADRKQIEADAKKINSKIGDNLYKLFVNATAYAQRDAADHYIPGMDGVPADNDVSKDEIAEAERTYLVWRNQAAQRGDERLDTVAEKSIRGMRGDPVAKAPEPGSIPAFSGPPKK
jgi:hypothetical protein